MRRARRGQRGFTLVEMLVAMGLFLLVGTIALSAIVALSRGADRARISSDITAEARVALERMARELRQADSLSSAQPQSMTTEVDFDGNGVIDGSLADPEVVTYTYDGPAKAIRMTATVPAGGSATQPLLAGHVDALTFTYTSSNWSKDANGDGVVTLFSPAEVGVADVDRVTIDLTVVEGGKTESFRTQVALRNRSQS